MISEGNFVKWVLRRRLGQHIVTAAQQAALAGTSGSPSATNKYVTDEDDRLAPPVVLLTKPDDEIIDATTGSGVEDADIRGIVLEPDATYLLELFLNILVSTTGDHPGFVGTLNVPGDVFGSDDPTFFPQPGSIGSVALAESFWFVLTSDEEGGPLTFTWSPRNAAAGETVGLGAGSSARLSILAS